jgi:hypothetical protein
LIPAFLEALPYNWAFSSNAVVDRACVDDVVAAFFDAIKQHARLPKIVSLLRFEADPIIYPAVLRHVSLGICRDYQRADAGRDEGRIRDLSGAGSGELERERGNGVAMRCERCGVHPSTD